MKNIQFTKYKVLLFAGLLCCLGACEESLDIEPSKELESSYFENQTKVQSGIAAAYAKLVDIHGGMIGRGGPLLPAWALPGDDITYQDPSQPFETFSGLNPSNGRIGHLWKLYYQMIGRCNFMLDRMNDPEVQAVYKTAGLIDNNRGEMMFLRSYAYYVLWDWFGKAPIQKERIKDISEAYLDPSSGFEMLDFAISSLEEALPLLPATWPAGQEGRITKDGAYGLLVKCYVLRACHNNKDAADYNKAIAAFEKLSDTKQLVIPFGNNFDYRTENNSESLFEFQATQTSGSNNPWLSNDHEGANIPTGAYYNNWNDHWSNSGAGICGPSKKLVDAFESGDPRMAETLSNNADNLDGVLWWITPQWSRFDGYQMVKNIKGERGNSYDPNWGIHSANNTRIIRLADVKLAVAEAYLATGNSTEALRQVNDVRERARKSTLDGIESAVPAALGAVSMNDIMDERFVELAGEMGIRWTDLRRWHVAGYINLGNWSATDFGFGYAANLFAFNPAIHLKFPIPLSEMTSNPKMAESGNNPGY